MSPWHCLFGHAWHFEGNVKRWCCRCGLVQALEFYSNRTQAWVTVSHMEHTL